MPPPEGEVASVASADAREQLSFLNEYNRAFQFAPCWREDELNALEPLGLRSSDFSVIRDGPRIAASAALWDQRNFKQTVIRGYEPWLALARPAVNAFAWLTNRPRLPAIGETLSNAFVSHLAALPDDRTTLLDLIGTLRAKASERGIQLLTLGLDAADPRLAGIRANFSCREYRSRIYVVRWPGLGGRAAELDGRPLAPEAALL